MCDEACEHDNEPVYTPPSQGGGGGGGGGNNDETDCDLDCQLENYEPVDRVDESEMLGYEIIGQLTPAEEAVLIAYARATYSFGQINFQDYVMSLLFSLVDIRGIANRAAESIWGKGTLDKPYALSDVFQHTYASALITKQFGPEFALAFTNAHETGYSTWSDIDQQAFQDKHNNMVGVSLSLANPNATPEELRTLVLYAIIDGQTIRWDGVNQTIGYTP